MRRTNKYYSNREKQIMKQLGLTRHTASGAGWIFKEDGSNNKILAQLKSTDNKSISIKLLDIENLERNALISHKYPIFIIDFISKGQQWIMVNIDDINLNNIGKEAFRIIK